LKVNNEVKELQKKVHDLEQQLSAACDYSAEARLRYQQLVPV